MVKIANTHTHTEQRDNKLIRHKHIWSFEMGEEKIIDRAIEYSVEYSEIMD